jgi:hypothetical protein
MTAATVTPTLQTVYSALMPFIVGLTGLPPASVIQGIQNRAAMPLPGFILVQALDRHRLRTNIDSMVEANPPISQTMEEGVELRVQIDCYGPSSCDWANMLSATLRDEYGVDALSPTLVPLYADDARMIPLVDAELQYEERWMVEANFQINPVTTIPQQYTDALDLTLVDVNVDYPT